jgi:hypothetical protein
VRVTSAAAFALGQCAGKATVDGSIMQLDIFQHSRDVMLRNELAQALQRGDAQAAGSARQALADEYPVDPALADASTLIDALTYFDTAPFTVPVQVQQARERVEKHVAPGARRQFGDAAADAWLSALWASLARRAAGLPYCRDDPESHCAALWLRAGDWNAAVEAVERIESWWRIPAPLAWMARARWQIAGFDLALLLLVELAWVSPRRFEELARGLEDRGLRALLRRFDADFEGSGDSDDAAWFPAWLLTEQPRLSEILIGARTSRGSLAEQGWQLMMTLLTLERQGRHAEVIEHRRRLKGLHEGLYRAYMKAR